MDRVSLEATTREKGKSFAAKARNLKLVPGIIYGKGVEPLTVSVNEKNLEAAVATQAGINVLLDLTVDGKDKKLVRIREYQADPIERNFVHIDFQVLDVKKPISVEIPLSFEGKSKGVKEGGVLVIDRRTLNVKCLPLSIPEKIVVDISELDVGDSVHVNDLKLQTGVECAHDINFSLVSVVAPMKEEVVVAAVTEGAVPVAGAAVPGAVPVAGAAPAGATPAAGAAAPAAAPAKGGAPAKGAAPAKEKK